MAGKNIQESGFARAVSTYQTIALSGIEPQDTFWNKIWEPKAMPSAEVEIILSFLSRLGHAKGREG